MPQVLRFAIPGLGNVWQLALKESALISVTGLTDDRDVLMCFEHHVQAHPHEFLVVD